jgi:transposase
MVTVEAYGRIRRAYRDGMSIRAIARQFGHSWRKVREVLAQSEPKPYTRVKSPPAPVLGPYHGLIEQILAADDAAPRKQRHTAMQVFRRLRGEHGYRGGYDQVRRYLQRKRWRHRETFIPLSHDPGQRAEVDFGHIWVDFPEGRRQVPVLLVTWAWSYCPFAMALPTERTEAILHGLVEAFEFFQAVPWEVWFDNPRTAALEILRGRQRLLHPRYAALASHYTFEPLFCLPARGNEKPHVENRVKDLERRWATPVPRMEDLAALNGHLRHCCLEDRERIASGQREPIGQRFEQERTAALSLPAHPFDACIAQPAKVDKYQTVRFDHNRYSVPRRWAFQNVTVKGYVDQVTVVADGQEIARHRRCYERGAQVLDPLHYLVTLGRKPACLDHSAVYRQWKLPPVFSQLREELEARHGRTSGARQFIRVLQLLGEHPIERVQAAIEGCRSQGLRAELIQARTERLGERPSASGACPSGNAPESSSVPAEVQVPLPDLSRFDQLLTFGDPGDVEERFAVAEDEPETVAFAYDGCGV